MSINQLGGNSRGADMSESQDDKYQTHNDHIDLLSDRFLKGSVLNIGFSSGSSYTLSVEEWTSNFFFEIRSDVSPSIDADFTFLLPATQGQLVLYNNTGFVMTVGVAASPGNTLQVLDGGVAHIYNDGENVREAKRDIYDLTFFTNTWTHSAIMGAHLARRSFLLPALGHAGYAWVPSGVGEADRVISVQKNDSEIGTFTFAALDADATFSITETSFATGDRLSLVNSDAESPDLTNTLADVAITLKAFAL